MSSLMLLHIVSSLSRLGGHVAEVSHSEERQWLLLRHGDVPARRTPLVHARLPEQVQLERPARDLPVPVQQTAARLDGAEFHAVRRRRSYGDSDVRLRRRSSVRRIRQDLAGAAVQSREGPRDYGGRGDDFADHLQGHDGGRAQP